MKVLLAEDDLDFGNILSQFISMNGFEVILTRDGKEAVQKFSMEKPDICILDVMMPEMDGFDVAEKIKQESPSTPFLFLTAKTLKEDVIRGLKLGADDYITKPFEPEELILRLNNILSRCYSGTEEHFRIGASVLNLNTLELDSGKGPRKLTIKEAELLRYFIRKKNVLIRREEVLKEIWGEDDYFMGRSMDVFISRIRKYLSDDKSINLRTIRGAGFILEEESSKK